MTQFGQSLLQDGRRRIPVTLFSKHGLTTAEPGKTKKRGKGKKNKGEGIREKKRGEPAAQESVTRRAACLFLSSLLLYPFPFSLFLRG